MSTASISYSSLSNASSEAKSVAKKLGKYADSLSSTVYKKLNSYDGSTTSNISNAKNKVSAKISALETLESKYTQYASDLSDLKAECKSVDKAVKSKVNSMTKSYANANGIKVNIVEYAISILVTKVKNVTFIGRAMDFFGDTMATAFEYFKISLKTWWDYDGGKELIKGVAFSVVLTVIGFATIIGTGGIAGWIMGLTGIASGLIGIYMESEAYAANLNNDPALAQRLSSVNSITDYLRSSFIFGTDGETYEYNRLYNYLALGIDVANLFAGIYTLGKGILKLEKNLFSSTWKSSVGSFFSQLKTGGLSGLKTTLSGALKSFAANLSKKFLNFSDVYGNFDIKTSAKSVKSLAGIAKTLLGDDFSLSSIAQVLLVDITLSGITIGTVQSEDVQSVITMNDGQLAWDFTENITLESIYSNLKGIGDKMISFCNTALDNWGSVSELLSKLSENLNVRRLKHIEMVSFDFDISKLNLVG